jgi:hypothetical protein
MLVESSCLKIFRGFSLAGIAGSNPAGGFVYCSGRALCEGPIPRPGESCRVCVCVIRCNNKPVHQQRVGRRGQTKKEHNKVTAYVLVVDIFNPLPANVEYKVSS